MSQQSGSIHCFGMVAPLIISFCFISRQRNREVPNARASPNPYVGLRPLRRSAAQEPARGYTRALAFTTLNRIYPRRGLQGVRECQTVKGIDWRLEPRQRITVTSGSVPSGWRPALFLVGTGSVSRRSPPRWRGSLGYACVRLN